jgi:hypothetical protein
MFDRRSFLSSLAGVAALGSASCPEVCREILGQAPEQLPDEANEEGYWTEVRKLFLIPEDEIYLNKGTEGSSPGLSSRVRLSTPYYLRKKDIDRFLDACDEYRDTHPA